MQQQQEVTSTSVVNKEKSLFSNSCPSSFFEKNAISTAGGSKLLSGGGIAVKPPAPSPGKPTISNTTSMLIIGVKNFNKSYFNQSFAVLFSL